MTLVVAVKEVKLTVSSDHSPSVMFRIVPIVSTINYSEYAD